MRRALMMIPLLFACAKSADTPPAEPAPTGPVALTEADVAGTWQGDMMGMDSDSVLGKWTQICGAGTCKGIFEGAKDTITSTYMLMADSSMGSTGAYMDPMLKKNVTDHWFAHFSAGTVTGTGEMRLAEKPDSVVMKYRFKGSKTM